MDPALIPSFAGVILRGEADYAKGNRFFELEGLASMPLGRLIGNAGLSFLTKISTGYWHSFDPTNGFFAIHASLISLLPLDKISKRYFFESDLLFRLNILTARVVDVPMHSAYGGEVSNMKPHREILRFAFAHLKNFSKRIFYNYFIKNCSIASVELVPGIALLMFGVIYGLTHWGIEKIGHCGHRDGFRASNYCRHPTSPCLPELRYPVSTAFNAASATEEICSADAGARARADHKATARYFAGGTGNEWSAMSGHASHLLASACPSSDGTFVPQQRMCSVPTAA
jgi:hypothetical protein